jgi:hypothetical protein
MHFAKSIAQYFQIWKWGTTGNSGNFMTLVVMLKTFKVVETK